MMYSKLKRDICIFIPPNLRVHVVYHWFKHDEVTNKLVNTKQM